MVSLLINRAAGVAGRQVRWWHRYSGRHGRVVWTTRPAVVDVLFASSR